MSSAIQEPLLVKDRGPGRIASMAQKTRVPEFLLAVLLTADGIPIPVLNFPYSLSALGLLAVLGIQRQAARRMGNLSWVPTLLTLALIYVCAVSALGHPTSISSDWTRRAIRIVFVVIFAMMLATERLHLGSILKGLSFGLVANVIAFELGLTPDTYAGALTGWVGDKNKAGMYYAVAGVLLLWQARSKFTRVFWCALFAVPVWLSESRTSMTAYAAGLLWTWVIAPRSAPVRWAGAAALMAAINYVELNFAQAGQFADRWGSDLLRERIQLATDLKLASTPIWGMGLGEAYVNVAGDAFFFHDSLATLRVEGGWAYFAVVVGITLLVGLRPFKNYKPAYQGMVAQGATVTLLVCAWKLGEVFLTIPWAILMGVAFNYLLKGEPPEDADDVLDYSTTRSHADVTPPGTGPRLTGGRQ